MVTLRIQETHQLTIAKQVNRHLELTATRFEGVTVATQFTVRVFDNDQLNDIITFANLRDALAAFDLLYGANSELANNYDKKRQADLSARLLARS